MLTVIVLQFHNIISYLVLQSHQLHDDQLKKFFFTTFFLHCYYFYILKHKSN